jgi:glycosyltransferase involved in cell wall biosynthesis
MKIAMLQAEIPPIGPGGVGYQVHLLSTELARRGHDVTVFAAHPDPGGTAYAFVQADLPGEGRLSRQFGVGRAFAALDLDGYDVVHAHGDDWLFGKSRPRIRTFYGTALMEAINATSWLRRGSQLCYYGLEWASARGAYPVSISEATRRQLPFIRESIPCAFDPSLFFPADPDPDREPSILFVAGTLKGRKRGDLLLEAFGEVRKRVPDAQLTIVSRDRVSHPGVTCYPDVPASRLAELYRRSWMLCSTSSYEGFGVPYIEALASGLPVVTTPNAGALEVLAGGRYGVVATPGDLVTSMVKLLHDGNERHRLAELGLERARAFTLDVVVSRYEHVYETRG